MTLSIDSPTSVSYAGKTAEATRKPTSTNDDRAQTGESQVKGDVFDVRKDYSRALGGTGYACMGDVSRATRVQPSTETRTAGLYDPQLRTEPDRYEASQEDRLKARPLSSNPADLAASSVTWTASSQPTQPAAGDATASSPSGFPFQASVFEPATRPLVDLSGGRARAGAIAMVAESSGPARPAPVDDDLDAPAVPAKPAPPSEPYKKPRPVDNDTDDIEGPDTPSNPAPPSEPYKKPRPVDDDTDDIEGPDTQAKPPGGPDAPKGDEGKPAPKEEPGATPYLCC